MTPFLLALRHKLQDYVPFRQEDKQFFPRLASSMDYNPTRFLRAEHSRIFFLVRQVKMPARNLIDIPIWNS